MLRLHRTNAQKSAASASRFTIATLTKHFITFCEARNLQPKTLQFYRERLSFLVEHFGSEDAEVITSSGLRDLAMSLRRERNWSVGTTNHFITACKAFFSFLYREELVSENPTVRLQKMKQEILEPETLTRDEVEKVLACCQTSFGGQRNRVMLLTLLDTGIRLEECLSLSVEDLDLQSLQIRVYGKGRKERFVPISPALTRQLARFLPLRLRYACSDDLWVSEEGTGITKSYFSKSLRAYGKQAGLKKSVHPHLFRHTFATEFLRNGGNPIMLQRILGHTTQVMTARYVHLTDTDAAEAHRAASPLERWRLGGRAQKSRGRAS